MPSQNGSVYGLTLFCPILNDDTAVPSHDLQIRLHLAELPTGPASPFAKAPGTHIARLVVLDDVIYVGMPACEEHLESKYLVMECDCDGDRDSYLTGLARHIPQELDAIWKHCVGYPGAANLPAFLRYMQTCQKETTFFFAPVNDKSVTQTLTALQTTREVAGFVAEHQDVGAERLRADFLLFMDRLAAMPPSPPAAYFYELEGKQVAAHE